MAVTTGAVWALDIGNNSLKALHLSLSGGAVEVIGFDNLLHGKILSGAGVDDAERDELIALTLRRFVQQNELGKDDVVVSVPSQNSFARFVNLPPVEKKRIPEIVKFEAAQQIPFDLGEVQWDWQLMSEPGSTETRVGIFAIKSDVVSLALEHYGRENIRVRYVQMAPMALYNYLLHDRPELVGSDSQAVVVINIGAENTDLVVCTKSTVWQRCVSMGGNAFTKAIAETFRLNFEKAEKLKRTAPMSKYARQILQAMKPVFADLGSEIQRSLGFYSNSNPGTKLVKIIALGGGTKMRGLLKYLQQTLQIPIERPDSFQRLAISSNVSTAKFHDSICDFGVVYGLALQALGLAKIESNLLPRRIARSMAWMAKAKYFTIAACMLLVVSLFSLGRTMFDRANYEDKANVRRQIDSVISMAQEAENRFETERSRGNEFEAIIQKQFGPFEYRDVIPRLHQTIFSVLPNKENNPGQAELYRAFAAGDVKTVCQTERSQRKQIYVTNMSVYFSNDIGKASFDSSAAMMEIGSRRTRGGKKDFMGTDYLQEDYGEEMKIAMEQMYGTGARDGRDSAEEGDIPGFVVTITGYSPYKAIGELMDPAGVGDDPNRWGVITRLLHLDEIIDGNSPFELYKKIEIDHFKLQVGEVAWDAEMPVGVGIVDFRRTGLGGLEKSVLVDPLTKEIITKVPEFDEDGREKIDRAGNVVYEVNDHWFILNLKFIWKDAPGDI